MKRNLFTIFLVVVIVGLILIFSKVYGSEGTSLKGQQGAVTFQHTEACSVAVLWMGKDTTSWEVDSVQMSRCFAADSTIFCYEPTLNSAGDYFVKVQYHTNAIPATVLYVGDHWFVSDVQTGISSNRDTLYIYESADSTAISGVTLTIYPDGGGVAAAQVTTDANGRTIVGLTDGDYDLYPYKQGWAFSIEDITISGDQTDTIWGTAFSPTPGAPGTITIFTWLLTPSMDTVNPSDVWYKLVPDSTGENDYERSDRLTSGVGVNKILHGKGWHKFSSDTSYITFPMVPSCDIYVNAVLDTSSWVLFRGKYSGNITELVTQIPDTVETFNPFTK